MKKMFYLFPLLIFLSGCSTIGLGEKTPPSLVIESVGKSPSKKCDYTGYVRVSSAKSTEIVPSPTNESVKVTYKGDNFNNLKLCYGETVVFKEMKEKEPVTFYFHFLGKVTMKDGYHDKVVFVGMTRQKKDKEDASFLFKAVQGDQVLDPNPYVDRLNTYIAATNQAIKDGLYIAK